MRYSASLRVASLVLGLAVCGVGQQPPHCGSQDLIDLGEDIAAFRLMVEKKGFGADQVNDLVTGYEHRLLNAREAACTTPSPSPSPTKIPANQTHPQQRRALAQHQESAAPPTIANSITLSSKGAVLHGQERQNLSAVTPNASTRSQSSKANGQPTNTAPSEAHAQTPTTAPATNVSATTVKPTTSQTQLVRAAAPAKEADPESDPLDPPVQAEGGSGPDTNTDTGKGSGDGAAAPPRFTTKPTLSSSAITVAGPAQSSITLRTHSDATKVCTLDGTPLIVSGGNNPATVTDNGTATFVLAESLTEGNYICATTGSGDSLLSSGAQPLINPLDFGRVRAYFASGIIVANNNSSNASSGSNSAALFLSFNVDKTWAMPGCYVLTPGHSSTGCAPIPPTGSVPEYVTVLEKNVEDAHTAYTKCLIDQSPTKSCDTEEEKWHNAQALLNGQVRTKQKPRWMPGINSYFDVRLTQIPVAATPPTQNSSNPTPPPTTNTGSLSTAFLTSQKTGRLGVGVYAPFLVSRWTYADQPNALFLAPIGKIGFNALTGPTQQTFVVSGGASGSGTTQTITQNFNQLYYFFNFGARIGHYTMTRSSDKAPELNSYLDITIGPYSNLPSYVCKAQPTNNAPLPLLVGSSCNSNYPLASGSNLVYGDSRTRLWRLDLEGILKVPHTPIIVGFNANIGQKVIAPGHLDLGVQPNDDLRFLFGFRSDIADILQKLGVGNPGK